MIEKLEECISLSKQQNEYIKVIKEGIESLKEKYRIACEYNKIADKKIEELNNIINELKKDFERKIQSCTIEAETTTNDFYCRLHIATLKRWLNKLQELKGSDK